VTTIHVDETVLKVEVQGGNRITAPQTRHVISVEGGKTIVSRVTELRTVEVEPQTIVSRQVETRIVEAGSVLAVHGSVFHNVGTPVAIAAANAEGSSALVPRLDHVHAHPQLSGDLHPDYVLADGSRPVTGKQDFEAGIRVDTIEELTPGALVSFPDGIKTGSIQPLISLITIGELLVGTSISDVDPPQNAVGFRDNTGDPSHPGLGFTTDGRARIHRATTAAGQPILELLNDNGHAADLYIPADGVLGVDNLSVASGKDLNILNDNIAHGIKFGSGGDVLLGRLGANILGLYAGDSFRILTGELQFGADVAMSRTEANKLAMAAGDTFQADTLICDDLYIAGTPTFYGLNIYDEALGYGDLTIGTTPGVVFRAYGWYDFADVVGRMALVASAPVTPNANARLEVHQVTPAANQTGLYLGVDSPETVEQVTAGAADSGGAGYRLLRVPN
jgi:hypothetical protein